MFLKEVIKWIIAVIANGVVTRSDAGGLMLRLSHPTRDHLPRHFCLAEFARLARLMGFTLVSSDGFFVRDHDEGLTIALDRNLVFVGSSNRLAPIGCVAVAWQVDRVADANASTASV